MWAIPGCSSTKCGKFQGGENLCATRSFRKVWILMEFLCLVLIHWRNFAMSDKCWHKYLKNFKEKSNEANIHQQYYNELIKILNKHG